LLILSPLVNTLGQLCGIGGRPLLQVLFQAVFTDSLRSSPQVIACALIVNVFAFSLGVPGYTSLGLYDSKLALDLATVAVPATILGVSAGSFCSDATLRSTYAALLALTACVCVARMRRLTPQEENVQDNNNNTSQQHHHLLSTASPKLQKIPSNSSLQDAAISRQGLFYTSIDVNDLSMLDESDADDDHHDDDEITEHTDDDDEEGDISPYSVMYPNPPPRLASNKKRRRRVFPSLESLEPQHHINNIHHEPQDALSRMLAASASSLSFLSTNAHSFISMSATNQSLLPVHASAAPGYGAIHDVPNTHPIPPTAHAIPPTTPTSPNTSQQSWPLLDLAKLRYTRPALTPNGKAILCFGGMLTGALGVGTAESVLIALIGLYDVSLPCAATAAISTAFYAQMTASVMDGLASTYDTSAPKIAESVPWKLIAALLPGVVVGALVGPRLHAFVPERKMLGVAAASLLAVSAAVAVVGNNIL